MEERMGNFNIECRSGLESTGSAESSIARERYSWAMPQRVRKIAKQEPPRSIRPVHVNRVIQRFSVHFAVTVQVGKKNIPTVSYREHLTELISGIDWITVCTSRLNFRLSLLFPIAFI